MLAALAVLALAQPAEALAAGNYEEAEAGFRERLPDADAALGLAETLRLTGRYDEALDALGPGAPLMRARIHIEIGEDAEALELLRAVPGEVFSAARLEAETAIAGIEARRGANPRERLEAALREHERAPPEARTAAGLVAAGQALVRLGYLGSGLVREALQLFDQAAALAPGDRLPRLLAAELLADKGNLSEAEREFRAVLDRNPRDPRALLGIARLRGAAASGDPLDAALAVNPRHPEARALRIVRLLEEDDAEAALEASAALLADLPRSPAALEARAGALFLSGDLAGAAAVEERFRTAFPGDPRLDLGVGAAAERTRRYREAAERAEAALKRDPESVAALRLSGLNLLRLGEMEAGRRALEAAFQRDPFDAFVKNTLDLLDELEAFTVVRAPPFEFVLPPTQADLLLPYLEAVSREAIEAFGERYGWRPDGTIRIEVYDRSADFSVRTVGMTGIGAHGVCFGNVIALESPSTREVGEYHWTSTLWHELAHAVTMGLTGNRVPRWFTEGMSQLEERRRFGDGASRAFYQAMRGDALLPLGELDEGFLRPTWPGQVGVSYYHSSLVLEQVEATYGFPAILSMLDGFHRGETSREVLPKVLGESLDALDAALAAGVEERFGAAANALADVPGPVSLPGLRRRADERPEDFFAQLAAGNALEASGRDAEAVPYLERAFRSAPDYGGLDGASRALSRIHERAGRDAEAAEALERHLALVPADHEGWVRLAALRRDPAEAAEALEAGLLAWPMSREPHERLADAFAELGDHGSEIRERRAVLATEPPDRAGALYRLARAHRLAGDRTRARWRVLEALEIAPTYRDALGLLRRLSEEGS